MGTLVCPWRGGVFARAVTSLVNRWTKTAFEVGAVTIGGIDGGPADGDATPVPAAGEGDAGGLGEAVWDTGAFVSGDDGDVEVFDGTAGVGVGTALSDGVAAVLEGTVDDGAAVGLAGCGDGAGSAAVSPGTLYPPTIEGAKWSWFIV